MLKLSTLQLLVAALPTLALAGACGSAATTDEPSLDSLEAELINGTLTNARPEVGQVAGPYGSCTGTMIAPRWVITAAHCIGFSTANPSSYSFFVGNPNANPPGQVALPAATKVLRLFNFGPSGYNGSISLNDWARQNLHKTTDHTGNDDVALLFLTTPIPASLVPSPARIANVQPSSGSTVTDFGYGCTNLTTGASDGRKRFAEWTYGTRPTVQTSTNGFARNAEGQLVPEGIGSSEGHKTGGHVCPGDSGGPVVLGSLGQNGEIWGVNSLATGTALGIDTFGAAAFLRKPICQAAYNLLVHSPCVTGAALSIPPQGCASSQTQAQIDQHVDVGIRAVCSVDPSCCNPWSSWDSLCVQRLVTLTGRPPGCAL